LTGERWFGYDPFVGSQFDMMRSVGHLRQPGVSFCPPTAYSAGMDYQLHLRVTSVASPTSGQPHAGGPGAGDVILDQIIDLRQWVAERLAIDPVEPAVVAPKPAVVAVPAPRPVVPAQPVVVTATPPVVPRPVPQTVTPAGQPIPVIRTGTESAPFLSDTGFRGDR
jgi:hypothetical protein